WGNQHTRRSDGLEFSKWNFVVQREYKKGDERIVEKINIPAEMFCKSQRCFNRHTWTRWIRRRISVFVVTVLLSSVGQHQGG
ncbi:MAG: hypothetical protein ACI814_001541, partial [Mariniblastus sp.]